ncbi:MAG TPA: arylsulfatase [Tepidisphaeraceae bacterium]|nr:arylsulfatase [Tepidisphaeraceae bacterium]
MLRLLPLLLLLTLPALAAPRPNILILLADDMGYSDLGSYGSEIRTPHLDALAAGGLRFTDFYNTSRCWPTRTALLSGYYPQQLRADPPKGRHPAFARLLPQDLKPLGYRSYHSGKWHVPGAPDPRKDGGFDRSYVLNDHDRFFNPKNHTEDGERVPPVKPGTDFYVTTHIVDRALDQLKDHATNHADKPFFSYVCFTSPHFPLQAPAADVAKYKDAYTKGWDAARAERVARLKALGIVDCPPADRRTETTPPWNLKDAALREQIDPGEVGRNVPWDTLTPEQQKFQAAKMAVHAAMVDRMDQEVGRLIAQLKATNALDNTVIFFASDNGASAEQINRGDRHDPAAAPGSAGSYLGLGAGWASVSNAPFALHKSYAHEGGIATPLIVHWPTGIKPESDTKSNPALNLRRTPGHVIDLVPTILEFTGAKRDIPAGGPPLPGRSLLPAFVADVNLARGVGGAGDPLYFHHINHRALRDGDWKIVALAKPTPGEGKPNDTNTPNAAWALYHLATDRGERTDLSKAHPDRVKQMAAKWEEMEKRFRKEAGEP